MIKTFIKIWNIYELRYKIQYTFILLLIYRFISYIPIPGIDPNGISNFMSNVNSESKGIIQILSSFTGGAFNRASVLALGVMPYISSSIIIQLMSLAIPSLQRLQRDGESGRREINKITRLLTVFICLIQTPAYIIALTKEFIPFLSIPNAYILDLNIYSEKCLFWLISIIVLTTGTIFSMWLGEKITDRGIGNGFSLIIMSGILSRLPESIVNEFINITKINNKGIFFLFLEFFIWLFIILFCIIIIQSVRKIPIQYVSRITNNNINYDNYANSILINQYIPLKVVSSGVMPIIFAQAIMLLPVSLLSYSKNENIKIIINYIHDIYGLWHNILFSIFIILFTLFYTAITIPINQIVDDLKKNGGFIPKIKPGKESVIFIDKILSKITLLGAILLVIIAILPSIIVKIGINKSLALFYGGTSLLIIVSVILEIMQNIDTYLLNHQYDGLMDDKNHGFNI